MEQLKARTLMSTQEWDNLKNNSFFNRHEVYYEFVTELIKNVLHIMIKFYDYQGNYTGMICRHKITCKR